MKTRIVLSAFAAVLFSGVVAWAAGLGGVGYNTLVDSALGDVKAIDIPIGQTTPAPGSFTTLQTSPATRTLNLSDARLNTGIISTATTGSTSGDTFGIARTAGTSYALVGAATSASAATTEVLWEVNVPATFKGGAIAVTVNANYTGSGTVTAASTTINMAAYTEVGGVETALTGITPGSAQEITSTATGYTFTIPASAAITASQHIAIEFTMVVTTSSGAATGQISGVSLVM